MTVPAADTTSTVADWQLPPGVDRGLWAYVHDASLARSYDAALRDCPLLEIDRRFVLRHCTPPGCVIDLGCGSGRMLVPLAQAGFRVVGVDLSQEMLKVAAEKAGAARALVDLLRANLVQLDALADEAFDYAVCLFSTLGMIGGHYHRRRVLEHVHRLLRPGGKFILHVHNRGFNWWNPAGRRWLLGDMVRSLLGSPHAGDRDMPAHDGQGGLTLHLFTRREIAALLHATGFSIEEVCPVSLREDGRLPRSWWLGSLRAYGYLIAARR